MMVLALQAKQPSLLCTPTVLVRESPINEEATYKELSLTRLGPRSGCCLLMLDEQI